MQKVPAKSTTFRDLKFFTIHYNTHKFSVLSVQVNTIRWDILSLL